jgi:HrpA-like RNA helicase
MMLAAWSEADCNCACSFLSVFLPVTGAVLVFLPSWQSIVDVYNSLAEDPTVIDRCSIFPLHSSLPINKQQ